MGIGWSVHRNDGWQGQLARVRRWHQRVLNAASTGSPDLQDFIFVFFQNCYHLREWLHSTSRIPKAEIDQLYSTTKELRLCRDICNGTKHLDLSNASVDAFFSIGYEYAPHEPGGSRLFLIADDKYDLLELAGRCLRLLEQFTARDPIKPVNKPIRPGKQPPKRKAS